VIVPAFKMLRSARTAAIRAAGGVTETGKMSAAGRDPTFRYLIRTSALSATQPFAGWFSPFLGQWPVWGNCPSDLAPAAKINSLRNLISLLA